MLEDLEQYVLLTRMKVATMSQTRESVRSSVRDKRCRAKFVSTALTVIVAASGLAGCSSTTPEPAPTATIAQSYIDEIDFFLDAPDQLSDFQRRVLKDYVVTNAEVQEAKDRYMKCVADKGYEGKFALYGTSYVIGLSPESHNEFVRKYQDDPDAGMDKELEIFGPCEDRTVFLVAELYMSMKYNPHDLDFAQLVRPCLEKVGVGDEASAIPDDELRDAINLKKLGDDAKAHCSRGVYEEDPSWQVGIE